MSSSTSIPLLCFCTMLFAGADTLDWNLNAITPVSTSIACGVLDEVEEWEAQGTATYTNADSGYEKQVSISTVDDVALLCVLLLTSSSCSTPLTITSGCHCSEATSGSDTVYTIHIRKTASILTSEKVIKASIFPIGLGGTPGLSDFGSLPLIYSAAETSCTLDTSAVTFGSSSRNQTGVDGTSAVVRCCVNNLIAPYTLKININSVDTATESNTQCVNTTITYDFETISTYNVKLEYTETSSCARSDNGDLNFYVGAPDAPEGGPSSSSNIGGIVGGICGAFGGIVGGLFGLLWWKKKKGKSCSNNLDPEKSGDEGQGNMQTKETDNGKTIPGRLPPINATKPSELGETPKTNIKESPTRKKKNKRRNRDSGERESEDPPTENLKIEAEDSPRPLPQRSPRQVTPAGDNGFNASLTNPHGVHTNFNTQQGGLGDISYNRPPSIEVTRGASRPLPEIRGKQF